MTLEDAVRISWEPQREGFDGDSELDRIERGIFSAVAYRDMFRFAPTKQEIHRYLPFVHCSLEQVSMRLERGPLIGKYLCTDGTHYALAGRSQHFRLRTQRTELSTRLMVHAVQLARHVASVPFVRMIALSGSLAALNADKGADVDLFIITEGGHLWRTRLLLRAARRIDHSIGTGLLCPNSMRTLRSMRFEWERLYIAHELQQMIPLYGLEVYERVISENLWTRQFLPNANGRSGEAKVCHPSHGSIRRGLEWLLGSFVGQEIENWWRDRKLGQFSLPGHPLHHYTPFTAEQEGLNLNVATTVEKAHRARLLWAGIQPDSRMDSALSQ